MSHRPPRSTAGSDAHQRASNNNGVINNIPAPPPSQVLSEDSKFFLAHLNFGHTARDVLEHFQAFGDVLHVKIVCTPDGKSRGFGFLYMRDDQGTAQVEAYARANKNRITLLQHKNVYLARHEAGRAKKGARKNPPPPRVNMAHPPQPYYGAPQPQHPPYSDPAAGYAPQYAPDPYTPDPYTPDPYAPDPYYAAPQPPYMDPSYMDPSYMEPPMAPYGAPMSGPPQGSYFYQPASPQTMSSPHAAPDDSSSYATPPPPPPPQPSSFMVVGNLPSETTPPQSLIDLLQRRDIRVLSCSVKNSKFLVELASPQQVDVCIRWANQQQLKLDGHILTVIRTSPPASRRPPRSILPQQQQRHAHRQARRNQPY